MNALEFKKLLRKLYACDEARQWASGKDLADAWATCPRVDWMLWLLAKMADQPGWPTRQQIILLACDCAETALQYVKPGEERPRIAIETARRWARGEATLDEVREARAAAAYAAAAY
ncbi:MAG: hypothetical protein JST28_17655, partial [Acidobacteria bacterium]|nr:hypothetical protein [Acidobacteriota bacterium]